MADLRSTQQFAEIAFDVDSNLRSTQQIVEAAFNTDPDMYSTQQSTEVLFAAANDMYSTQQSTEVLFAAANDMYSTQQSAEVIYRGLCPAVDKVATFVAGNWVPIPANTAVEAGCIESELSPSSDEVVIGFAPIIWTTDNYMELLIKFNKADSGDTPQDDGDEISLVVDFMDGTNSIWSRTYLDVVGEEGTIIHPFSVAEKALISVRPKLRASVTANTTAGGTARKIRICDLDLCSDADPLYPRLWITLS